MKRPEVDKELYEVMKCSIRNMLCASCAVCVGCRVCRVCYDAVVLYFTWKPRLGMTSRITESAAAE